jgi:hypothetical protein
LLAIVGQRRRRSPGAESPAPDSQPRPRRRRHLRPRDRAGGQEVPAGARGLAVDDIVGEQTWDVSLHAASATLETEVGLNVVIG